VEEHKDNGAILLVSRNAQNLALLKDQLHRQGYQSLVATTVGEFGKSLEADGRIKLALVDLTGFDASIWPLCDRLREAHTPLLMLAARKNSVVDETGRAHGASSVLQKPVGVQELVGLIQVMIED
jgi:DNA-binding response OmpR family regulator